MAFRPSEAKLRYFLSAAGDIQTEDAGAARYGPEAGFSSLGLTPTFSRVSVAGNIAGLTSEPETLPGAIATGPVPFVHPLRASLWELGLLYSLFGAAKTPVQLDVSTAYSHQVDDQQTDIVLDGATDRALHFYFDKTGDLIERWAPARIQSWALNVANNAVVQSTWNPISLQYGHYDGILSIDIGTPTVVPIIRGWLDSTNAALAEAEQQLNLKVSGAPTGAGTAADPKVIVFTADLGSTPSYGAVTFAVTCGLDLEGQPRWTAVKDSTSGSHLGDPASGVPLEIAITDVTGTGWADLDAVSTVLIPSWTQSLTTEPTLLSVHACLSIDGSIVSTPESFDSVITNDWQLTPGGIYRAMSQGFNRGGLLTGEFGFSRRWITDRHQEDIRHGAQTALILTLDSGLEIDPGTSNETYKITLTVPNLRPSDGSLLKSFPGGAADTSEALTYRAHPDSTIGDASIRADVIAAVADVLV